MATIADISATNGPTIKAVTREARANGITVTDVYGQDLSGPQTTTVTNACLANERIYETATS